jgi:hypothetical protein
MRTRIPNIGKTYSVSLWFWNGMPHDARPVTGYLFSRGRDLSLGAQGDHLGIGGTSAHTGKLIFQTGDADNAALGGRTTIDRWTWNHVVLIRDAGKVTVYLNGNPKPEIDGQLKPTIPPTVAQFFLGGRNDNNANFEGRLDETAIYDRALTADEATSLYRAATAQERQAKAGP